MPAARDDYIMRMIQQAAEALRRLRSRLGSGDAAEEVIRDADTAIGNLLGPQRAMLDRLDAWSAANLIGDQERLVAWIELLRLKSDAAKDSDAGRQWQQRADALRAHVKASTSPSSAHG